MPKSQWVARLVPVALGAIAVVPHVTHAQADHMAVPGSRHSDPAVVLARPADFVWPSTGSGQITVTVPPLGTGISVGIPPTSGLPV